MNITLSYIKKKYRLDFTGHQPVKIDTIGRVGLASLFAELGYGEGAEIGVDRGAFSEILCQANPKLHLTSIDSWSFTSLANPVYSRSSMQKQYEEHYQDALQRLAKYNCTIIRKESLLAVKNFNDRSLDFVYIDANHDFPNIANDLYSWEKKVRVGGIISGHDYHHFPPTEYNHVKHVVDAFVVAFEIKPHFELGQDKYHSWFWVKQ